MTTPSSSSSKSVRGNVSDVKMSPMELRKQAKAAAEKAAAAAAAKPAKPGKSAPKTGKTAAEKELLKKAKQAAAGGKVYIMEPYTDKSIAVVGDTKPVKDLIKSVTGWKFNRNLSNKHGNFPGWIFSAKKLADLKKVLKVPTIKRDAFIPEKTGSEE